MTFYRKHFNMDMDWRFHRGEVDIDHGIGHKDVYRSTKTGGTRGPATKRAYDDSLWESVDLPHDYMREAAYSPEEMGNHGYREFANGWYRKTFNVDASLKGKHAMLVFDGIATSSVIYLNGSVIYRSFNMYSEIAIDVTDRLYYDRINTIAVYTRGDDIEGWWYEGAGIYRHVHLYIKDTIHIVHNGLWARPILCDKEKNEWQVELEITLENSEYTAREVKVRARILDGDRVISEGDSEKVVCPPDGKTAVNLFLKVASPRLWDVDSPNLYRLEAELYADGASIDSDATRIGFRTFSMDADKGFFLNGRPLKIKGTCNHQDHAGVGVAVPDSIQYYRIRRLKEMGTNAYRCAHNPPAREILDACDELGLIVMDENRTFETRKDAVENLENLIKRDRNHPSVMFYSLFNEEPLQNSPEGAAIFRRLKSCVKKLDDSRLILGAVNDTMHVGGAGEEMDVFGLNYGLHHIENIHREFPNKPIIGSENNSAVTVRGCYKSDREVLNVLNNYDEELVPWGSSVRNAWNVVRSHDYFSGIFIWTGFDYRGEPTPFTWPTSSSLFGIMDSCGFPKDSYYFNQATFIDEPMMHILPHWNWSEGETVRVMTVTNCDEVELFLNGRSLGRVPSDICEQNEWQVPFEKGILTAVGYRNGIPVAKAENKTAGKAVAIKLIPDRMTIGNGGQDTVPVRVSVVDENGIELPNADDLISFEIEGNGVVLGVGNGDPNSHEPEHTPYRHLYCGLCQVLIKAGLGAKVLKLIAKAEGLTEAAVDFEITDVEAPDYIFSRPNNAISGMMISVSDSPEKPDPTKVYSDNDMNSLAPFEVTSSFDNYRPAHFYSGWRELRFPVKIPTFVPDGKVTTLEFATVICEKMEIYAGGKLIFEAEPEYKAPVTVPIDMPAGSEAELCVLVKAKEGMISGNGFSIGISLSFAEKK